MLRGVPEDEMIEKPSEKDLRRDLNADWEYWDDLDLWMSDEEQNYAREAWGSAISRADAAEKFKAWVHDWLDRHEIPHDPDPEHTAANGCRISGRMEYLWSCLCKLKEEVEALHERKCIHERAREWSEETTGEY